MVPNELCGASTSTLGAVGCYRPARTDEDEPTLGRLIEQGLDDGCFGQAICDCEAPPPVACVDGKCMAEAWSDESLCEATGGAWNAGSCGHYSCGREPACEALIPGCDCGPLQNFEAGLGCVRDPDCGLD
jgi:hypothetical protein